MSILSDTNLRVSFGICIGDIVMTSYGTGPYLVTHVHGPYDSGSGVPKFSLCCNGRGKSGALDHKGFVINNVRRDSGRYLNAAGDEITVIDHKAITRQLPLIGVD